MMKTKRKLERVMKTKLFPGVILVFVIAACLAAVPAMAQTYKMTTPIAPGVAVPGGTMGTPIKL